MHRRVLLAGASVVEPSSTQDEIPVPSAEVSLIAIASTAQSEARSTENEMKQDGIKARRDKAVYDAIPQLAVHDWIGTVEKLESNTEGKGIVGIALARTLWLRPGTTPSRTSVTTPWSMSKAPCIRPLRRWKRAARRVLRHLPQGVRNQVPARGQHDRRGQPARTGVRLQILCAYAL